MLKPVCCIVCKQEKSIKGIFSHFNIAHTPEGKEKLDNSRKNGISLSIKISNNKKFNRISNYNTNPNICKCCKSILDYKNKKNKFCSKSCAATFNNINRDTPAKSLKLIPCISCNELNSVSSFITQYKCEFCKNNKPLFSRVYINNCYHCGTSIKNIQSKKKYCNSCNSLYSDYGRVPYYFKFNIFDYPELFNLDLIKQHGYFSNGKNNSKINIGGASRDHKISISTAIKNNYDPFYISHPLNCEVMLHNDNIRKNSKSSIEYSELIKIVDEYEMVRKVRFELTKLNF